MFSIIPYNMVAWFNAQFSDVTAAVYIMSNHNNNINTVANKN